MASATRSLLGLGLYPVPEAARLLRMEPRRLRRWAQGYYVYRSGTVTGYSEPVVRPTGAELGLDRMVTFLELVELHLVAMFRNAGVSMQVIRAAARRAAELFRTDHPFAVRRFDTDGKRIFGTLRDEPLEGIGYCALMEELDKGQMVFASMVQPFFRKLDMGEDEPLRYWPLGKSRCVVMDPHRMLGRPVDSASGVPTLALYEAVLSGDSLERIANWYEVAERAVLCAREFEEWLRAA